jgi:D-ribose pyranose/furanose isomerase RbsD
MTHQSKHEDINDDMNHGDGGGVGTMVDEEMVIETVVCEEEMKHKNHHSKHEDITENMNHGGGGGGTMVDEEMIIEQWCVKRK